MEANKKESLTKLLNVLGVEPDMQEVVNIILSEERKESSAVKIRKVIDVLKKKEATNARRIRSLAWELCTRFTDNPRIFAPIVSEAMTSNTSYVIRALDEIIFWGRRTENLGTDVEVAQLKVDWDSIDPFRNISENDKEINQIASELFNRNIQAEGEEKCNCHLCQMQARKAENTEKSKEVKDDVKEEDLDEVKSKVVKEEVKEEVKKEEPATSPELLAIEVSREMNPYKEKLKDSEHFVTAEDIIFTICKNNKLTTLHYDIFNLLLFGDENPKEKIKRSKGMVRNAMENGLKFVGGDAERLKIYDYKKFIVAPYQFFEFLEASVRAYDLYAVEDAIETYLEGEFYSEDTLALCNVDNTFKSKKELVEMGRDGRNVYEDDCLYLSYTLGLTKYHYLILDALISVRVRNTPIVERIKNAIALMKEAYDKEIFSGSPSDPSTSEDKCTELLWERHADVLDQLTSICYYDGDCKSWIDGIAVLEGLAHDYSPEDVQWDNDNPDVDED